jgi:hypothetical protein
MVAFDVFGGRRTSLPQQIAGWRRPRPARGLAVLPAADYPTSVSLNRLAYEYRLKDELDGASAIRTWNSFASAGDHVDARVRRGRALICPPVEVGRLPGGDTCSNPPQRKMTFLLRLQFRTARFLLNRSFARKNCVAAPGVHPTTRRRTARSWRSPARLSSHRQWRETDDRRVAEMKATGTAPPLRKNTSTKAAAACRCWSVPRASREGRMRA